MTTTVTLRSKALFINLLLGLGSTLPLVAQSLSALRIAAGYSHSIALVRSGAIAAHGENRGGEIGDGTTTARLCPVYLPPPAGQQWAQVTTGDFRSTALTTAGEMYSWGSNGYGQLGDGTRNDHGVPFRIAAPAGTSWAGVAAGFGHTLALCADGTLYAWGDNSYGQLGIGSTAGTLAHQLLRSPSGRSWVQVAAGYNFSLALCDDGSLYTWGNNDSGQLGDGTRTARPTPVRVAAPSGQSWTQAAGGFWSTAALCSDGSLYTWGRNNGGQLGNGNTTDQPAPVRLAPPVGQRWQQVTVGDAHMLAIGSDGSLYGWGDNYYGELGDGTTTSRPTPVRIAPAQQWLQAAAGAYHSLALAADGQVYGTGHNYSGQLGNGNMQDTNHFGPTCNNALATTPATPAAPATAAPNPFEDVVRVGLPASASGPIALALYTTLGQCVKSETYGLPVTKEVVLHDLIALPAGLYLLQISTAQGKRTVKLTH
ncbi:T9SS type A sorting domain-containing protein [Hymenobacter caeli]|uniref:Alpha-tubulin suppressor-like RCC1 family protein n=1 Tax=Hymenobacter caeli TaxID=2735894 RepID=A0ABX2FQJ5_9BACT|nr:T9SS type A sorting domain-containing protein [Hymenobacter caeli]NRT18759.1 alpha-tubulin suppressor-like RCC1 family protein [Hymenobacter caeli]